MRLRHIQSALEPNPELQRLLEAVKFKVLSDDELWEQGISFAYGNASPSDLITKESVRRAANRRRLA